MKQTYVSTGVTAPIPSRVALLAVVSRGLIPFSLITGCLRLFAVAISLATFTPVFGQTPPGITTEPRDQVVDTGFPATFTVTATGTAPLTYQWRFNDTNLAGRTSANLVLANVQLANLGNYTVSVTNASGPSVTSRVAVLTLPTVHRLDGMTTNPDHTISLSLAGVVPSVFAAYYDIYPLDTSTDLADWSPLATLLRTNASPDALSYRDSEATNPARRFYRTPANLFITPFPKPSGSYPVGTVSRLMTDPTFHSFMVTFWYPAQLRAGVLPEAYVENNATVYAYLNERNPAIVAKFVSHAFAGLPFATNEISYPVLLFSTSGATRRQNTDKALELASHGYVVVAMEYVTGVTFCVIPKSCFVPTLEAQTKVLQFVSDELSRLNTNDPLFAGRLDMERLGAFGFSNGCTMAAEFCRRDARCKAAVLLDVGSILEAAPDLTQVGLQKPFLSMNSTIEPRPVVSSPPYGSWLDASLALFAKATGDAFWLQIQDASHQSFQDRGSLISDQRRTADPTPASRAPSQTIRACMLSFFDKYLKNQDDHLLDNPAAAYPNVVNFQRK